MKKLSVILVAVLLLTPCALNAQAEADKEVVLFSEQFDGELDESWEWLREDPEDWRLLENALEIRARPGDGNSVRNALLRFVPEVTEQALAFEITVTFTTPLKVQYEQAGLTWYADETPVFKLVHELIDEEYFIIPGRIPTKAKVVRLRLEIDGSHLKAMFYEIGEDEENDTDKDWELVAEQELEIGKRNHISIQTYHGPEDEDHWMRFTDFKILKISE